jgi:hypothetical protein
LQARLAATHRNASIKKLKDELSPETVSRMESRANKASHLLWKAYPLTQEFALTDEETAFAVAYATGQRLPHIPERCSCARNPDLTMEHTVHCAEKLTRHNMIQERLVTFARQHSVPTRQNPRLVDQPADERLEPDVVFYPGITEPIQTDVTVINPCAPFRLAGSKNGHLYATSRQRTRKNTKYLAQAEQKGEKFKPLVFETHGKMDTDVSLLLELLASRTPMDRGLAVSDMKLDLAVTLARGNALAARTTIARAQRARDYSRAKQHIPASTRRANKPPAAASSSSSSSSSSSACAAS